MKTIRLTQGKAALVDDQDYEQLVQFKWHARKSGNVWYAARNIKTEKGQRIVNMHREILELKDSSVICDHIDNNGLNNTRKNLRKCSSKQNSRNRRSARKSSSPYLGVSYRTPWCAKIRVDGKLINIGCFNTQEEAAEAYNKAAAKHFKEFANLNII